jgi:hypothetical protein
VFLQHREFFRFMAVKLFDDLRIADLDFLAVRLARALPLLLLQ